MADIIRERVCAEVEGDVVVFLIGMRANAIWKVWKWLPVVRAMGRMLPELAARPALGMLASRAHFGIGSAMLVQYWRSSTDLLAYAHAKNEAHLPAWRDFNRTVGVSGDVGIWHETYVVPAGASESIYVNMPRFGLGLAGKLVPAQGRHANTAGRLSIPARSDSE